MANGVKDRFSFLLSLYSVNLFLVLSLQATFMEAFETMEGIISEYNEAVRWFR